MDRVYFLTEPFPPQPIRFRALRPCSIFLKERPGCLVSLAEPNIMTTIAKYPVGRMVLHLICIVKHPANFKWHLRGIGREIGVGTQPATL